MMIWVLTVLLHVESRTRSKTVDDSKVIDGDDDVF